MNADGRIAPICLPRLQVKKILRLRFRGPGAGQKKLRPAVPL
jgi:hypothetical protein